MNIMSTLRWLFFPNPTDPKHLTLIHPLISYLISTFSTTALFALLAKRWQRGVPSKFDRWARRILGPLIIVYLAAFLTSRTV